MLLLLFHIFRWFFCWMQNVSFCVQENMRNVWMKNEKRYIYAIGGPFFPSQPTTHNIIRIITIIILILSVLASSWEAVSPRVVGAIIRSSLVLSTGTKAFVAREHEVTWQCQYHCKCKMLKKGKLILHTITNPSLLCILPHPDEQDQVYWPTAIMLNKAKGNQVIYSFFIISTHGTPTAIQLLLLPHLLCGQKSLVRWHCRIYCSIIHVKLFNFPTK